MASLFTTVPGNTVRGFGGRIRPIPFYLQFVPGVCIETVTGVTAMGSNNSEDNVNSILAIPHIYDGPPKKKSALDDNDRYFPLMRGMFEVPAKGDPVLLCSISGRQYYLGPLNTQNKCNWNDDVFDVKDFPTPEKFATRERRARVAQGQSLNFIKQGYSRLAKDLNEVLDNDKAYSETHGDMMFEGRHGNSIRIGSRKEDPYIYISNSRDIQDTYENLGVGTLISITKNGTLAQHFGGYSFLLNESFDEDPFPDNPDGGATTEDEEREIESINGFTLASDLLLPNETQPTRLMGTLVSSVNNDEDVSELIYGYGDNQLLLHSDRITLNSKLEDMYLSSHRDIHIGARRHLTISTNEDLIIESERTFLGNPVSGGESRDMEPMVHGKKLVELLTDFLAVVKDAQCVCQGAPIPLPGVKAQITPLEQKLNDLLSNKHFIEPNT